MKVILLFLSLIFCCCIYSQSHQLLQHNGTTLDVNYIKQEGHLVYYSNFDSQEHQSISIHVVAEVKSLTSSKKQVITQKTEVRSKDDYLKVIVLEDEKQTVGLKKVQLFNGQLNKAKGISVWEQYEITKRAVKYRTAGKGFPFVIITRSTNGSYEATAYDY
jgi:hypothetical protein